MVVLIANGSARMVPTFLRGLSEPNGSWNTICTARRMRRRSALVAVAESMPSRVKLPAVGGSIWVISRASVDLPQPDSPTTARVLPGTTLNDTPSSAFRVAALAKGPRPT